MDDLADLSTPRWYVLRTKPKREAQVASLLESKSIPVFLPKIKARRPKRRAAWEPLFPGYLFCRLGAELEHWRIARWSPGTLYLLGTDGVAAWVPDSLIE